MVARGVRAVRIEALEGVLDGTTTKSDRALASAEYIPGGSPRACMYVLRVRVVECAGVESTRLACRGCRAGRSAHGSAYGSDYGSAR